MAIEIAKQNLDLSLSSEFEQVVTGKENFKTSYIAVIRSRATFEVVDLSEESSKKVATVKVQKIPQQVRKPLLEIIQKIEGWKENKFNMSDAINLIYQQLGLPKDKTEEDLLKINLAGSSAE